jgi:hypothetical protein
MTMSPIDLFSLSVTEYKTALIAVENQLTELQRRVLRLHYQSPYQAITATILAHELGYRSHNPINPIYGGFARKLWNHFNADPGDEQNISILIGSRHIRREAYLILTENFVDALHELNWFGEPHPIGWDTLPQNISENEKDQRIYDAVQNHAHSTSADVEAVRQIIQPLRSRSSRQGYGLDATQRRVIELHAMQLAHAYYSAQWNNVVDVSANESCDFICHNTAGDRLFVEVKGTTGSGDTILLTANEVQLAVDRYPNTALFIVSHIQLHNDETGQPIATGGQRREFTPWHPDHHALRPTAYECRLSLVQ